MKSFGRSDDLAGAQFDGANLRGANFINSTLRGARFARSDLSGVVMRGVDVQGLEIDAPWLLDGESTLMVNGVDVAPFVAAELNRRFPGRAQQRADDPQGLRKAWTVLQDTWAHTLARAAALPQGSLDVSVEGEWSFAQTLRHLVMATDVWLRKAILSVEQPFHPLGQAGPEAAEDGMDLSVFATGTPPYAEVLAARASRVGMVGEFLASVTPGILSQKTVQPVVPGVSGDCPLLPACDPGGGVGAPPLCGAGPGGHPGTGGGPRDQGRVSNMSQSASDAQVKRLKTSTNWPATCGPRRTPPPDCWPC